MVIQELKWRCNRHRLRSNTKTIKAQLKPKEEPHTINSNSMTKEAQTLRRLHSRCLPKNSDLIISLKIIFYF